jgi:hypothetical protein
VPTAIPTAIPNQQPVVVAQQPVITIVRFLPRRPSPARTPPPTAIPTVEAAAELPPPPLSARQWTALTAAPLTPAVARVEDWLLILAPIQTYSVEMDTLQMAQPGDWYRVMLTEGDFALVDWEGNQVPGQSGSTWMAPAFAEWSPRGRCPERKISRDWSRTLPPRPTRSTENK